MSVRHSEYQRAAADFYVEPDWCVRALLDHLPVKELHDPCCGSGTIVATATQRGVAATGADIADRASGLYPVKDFFTDTMAYKHIVTNPPFASAARIITHALNHLAPNGRVAVLVPITFLSSRGRHPLFTKNKVELVLILSRRQSMPPGAELAAFGESIRGNGSIDFCWIVFSTVPWVIGPPRIAWAL